MSQFKYVAARGQLAKDFAPQAGSAIGTDQISVAFDTTNMTKRDALELLDQVKRNIQQGKFPPL